MRKLLLVLLGVVVLVTLSTVSFATPMEVTVYMQDGSGWVTPPQGEPLPGLRAKAFTSNPQGGTCDKQVWETAFTNHVTVAQWIDYNFGGTRWDWQIRKPGTFAADCIEFSIQSNDDVNVSFCGFDNLAPLSHPDAAKINVWYNYGPQGSPATDTPPAAGWVAAPDLNGVSFTLPYDLIKNGFTKKLWNKIEILPTTRACDYENSGVITLTLTDIKYFINPETGDYNGAIPGQK